MYFGSCTVQSRWDQLRGLWGSPTPANASQSQCCFEGLRPLHTQHVWPSAIRPWSIQSSIPFSCRDCIMKIIFTWPDSIFIVFPVRNDWANMHIHVVWGESEVRLEVSYCKGQSFIDNNCLMMQLQSLITCGRLHVRCLSGQYTKLAQRANSLTV